MPVPPRALTDQQIQKALEDQIQRFLQLGCHLAALEKALVRKGLLSEDDILQALKEVKREGDQQMTKLRQALQTKPGGETQ